MESPSADAGEGRRQPCYDAGTCPPDFLFGKGGQSQNNSHLCSMSSHLSLWLLPFVCVPLSQPLNITTARPPARIAHFESNLTQHPAHAARGVAVGVGIDPTGASAATLGSLAQRLGAPGSFNTTWGPVVNSTVILAGTRE